MELRIWGVNTEERGFCNKSFFSEINSLKQAKIIFHVKKVEKKSFFMFNQC